MRPLSPRTEEGMRVIRDVFGRLAASWYLLPFALATFVCTLVWVVRPEREETSPRLSAGERFRRGMRAYDNSLRLLGPVSLGARTEQMKNALLHLKTLESQYGIPAEMCDAYEAMGDIHLKFASLAAKGMVAAGGRGWNLKEAARGYAMFLRLAEEEEPLREAACARAEALVELGEYEPALSILGGLLRDIERAQVDALLEEKRTGVRAELGRAPLRRELATKARLLAGTALFGLGREDEAEEELERFLASGGGTHEERSRGTLLLARMLLKSRSSLDRARERFRTAPGPEARLGLARIEFTLGNHARALEILSRRPRLSGKWGRAADFLAGLCLLEEGKYTKAAHAFSRLTRLHPSSPEGVASVVGLAEAALEARVLVRAKDELEKACALIPPPTYESVELPERDERLTRAYVRRLLVELAGKLEQAGLYGDSYDAFRLASGQGLAPEDFARAASRVLARKGGPRDFVRSAELLLGLKEPDSVLLASVRFRQASDPAGAAHACRLFLRLFPGDARATRLRHEMALALRDLGLFRRARSVFRENSPRTTERARDPYAYESQLELARSRVVHAELEPAHENDHLRAARSAYRGIIRDSRFKTDSLIFAKAVYELAGVEARLGLESAERWLSTGLERYSPSKELRPLLWEYSHHRAPEVCVEAGHLFRKKGRFAKAAGWYAEARRLGAGAEAAVFEALAVRALGGGGPVERSVEILRLAQERARAAGDGDFAAFAAELAQKAKDGSLSLSILKVAAGPGGNAEESVEKAR